MPRTEHGMGSDSFDFETCMHLVDWWDRPTRSSHPANQTTPHRTEPKNSGLLDLVASFPRAMAELDRLDLSAQDLKGACFLCGFVYATRRSHVSMR